ncbi:type II toxin-antitoxin system Phd/YefM family antitoxin [Patescibacteria group bacterium]|nr:type II toxin-antitoxin system Phd/YefM family antitoxin [Patescibacteria group bacterium]
MNGVITTVNSAVFRSNIADFLENIARSGAIVISRFGQPKAVMVDRLTYKIQKTVMELLDKFPKLSKSEQETLNLLMDKNARENLIKAMSDSDSGKGVSGAVIFK